VARCTTSPRQIHNISTCRDVVYSLLYDLLSTTNRNSRGDLNHRHQHRLYLLSIMPDHVDGVQGSDRIGGVGGRGGSELGRGGDAGVGSRCSLASSLPIPIPRVTVSWVSDRQSHRPAALRLSLGLVLTY